MVLNLRKYHLDMCYVYEIQSSISHELIMRDHSIRTMDARSQNELNRTFSLIGNTRKMITAAAAVEVVVDVV